MTRFGDVVRKARLNKGLKQVEVANLLIVKQGVLCNIEKGREYWISKRIVAELARILNLPHEQLEQLAEIERKKMRKRDQV